MDSVSGETRSNDPETHHDVDYVALNREQERTSRKVLAIGTCVIIGILTIAYLDLRPPPTRGYRISKTVPTKFVERRPPFMPVYMCRYHQKTKTWTAQAAESCEFWHSFLSERSDDEYSCFTDSCVGYPAGSSDGDWDGDWDGYIGEYDGSEDDRCIGDCNDMDGDGRTWNDVDADGDGLYESRP